MLSLILETSTEKSCLILAEGGTPLRFKRLAGGPDLSKTLALEVKNLLDGQIPALIAIGTGPGSYTGVRVGTALAKALSYGWQIPLLGFCSLAAFGPGPVLVDARMGGFYALLDRKPQLLPPSDPTLQKISIISSPHSDLIKKRLHTQATFLEKDPDINLLSQLVHQQFLEEGAPPFELTYLSCP